MHNIGWPCIQRSYWTFYLIMPLWPWSGWVTKWTFWQHYHRYGDMACTYYAAAGILPAQASITLVQNIVPWRHLIMPKQCHWSACMDCQYRPGVTKTCSTFPCSHVPSSHVPTFPCLKTTFISFQTAFPKINHVPNLNCTPKTKSHSQF